MFPLGSDSREAGMKFLRWEYRAYSGSCRVRNGVGGSAGLMGMVRRGIYVGQIGYNGDFERSGIEAYG